MEARVCFTRIVPPQARAPTLRIMSVRRLQLAGEVQRLESMSQPPASCAEKLAELAPCSGD